MVKPPKRSEAGTSLTPFEREGWGGWNFDVSTNRDYVAEVDFE